MVILAENKQIKEKLAYYDLNVQTLEEVAPLQVYPARVLSHIFAHLGEKPQTPSYLASSIFTLCRFDTELGIFFKTLFILKSA